MATKQATIQEIDRGGCADATPAQIVLSWGENNFALTPSSAEYCCKDISLDEYADLDSKIRDQGSPAFLETLDEKYIVHVFGTDFDELVHDVRSVVQRDDLNCEGLLIDGFDSVGDSAREVRDRLARIGEVLEQYGNRIGIIDADPSGSDIVTFEPGSDEFDVLLSTLDLTDSAAIARHRKSNKSDIQRWCNIEYNGGRPGLGFETRDGELVPATDYETVCATLDLVRIGEMSKRKAAAHLNTSPRTITRCLEERPKRYGLPIDK